MLLYKEFFFFRKLTISITGSGCTLRGSPKRILFRNEKYFKKKILLNTGMLSKQQLLFSIKYKSINFLYQDLLDDNKMHFITRNRFQKHIIWKRFVTANFSLSETSNIFTIIYYHTKNLETGNGIWNLQFLVIRNHIILL